MKKSALNKGIVLILILLLPLSVMGAGVKECLCSDAIHAKAKANIPTGICPLAGGCKNTPAPPPPADESCPCKDNSCTFFTEDKPPNIIFAHMNGAPIFGNTGPTEEKIVLSTDRGRLLVYPLKEPILYLHLQNLRC